MSLDERFKMLEKTEYVSLRGGEKVVVFEKGGVVFIFNFHPDRSFVGFGVPVRDQRFKNVELEVDFFLILGRSDFLILGIFWSS